ncbi:methylisocitrate lyase [Francisella philomiragia]|uniref:methylisocitrate lyase n=1 Tax=Francisella philomiragia TaxID=28110 RepID=UPI0019051F78|nr:methylisocitrate lyase [Francisella philomiragia]MBK2295681.1 methylisocitrate lyase [Francisella philomiragia]MBK2340436.1 methylisocitrate lyase [Francisella philomiragia]
MSESSGKKFRTVLERNTPLQIVGTVNAYSAILAKSVGFEAIYVSGGALSAVSYGMPDLGIIDLNDVLIDVNRITNAVDIPVIVDIDTGFGDAFGISRTIKSMIKVGAAGIHIEDQVSQKRCGHRPNKQLVSSEEMCDRLVIADNQRLKLDPDFYLIARTDAIASEGIEKAVERALAYQNCGVDAIFVEACQSLADYKLFTEALDIPILANITEFGSTPLFTVTELSSVNVGIILYPFTATRMMNQSALEAYKVVKNQGTQKEIIQKMQTREELYNYLGYHKYEDYLDGIFEK